MQHLFTEGDVNAAAALCPKILKRDAKLWQKWIYKFYDRNELRALVDYIPVGNPLLEDTVYEMVLAYFMNSSEPRDHLKLYGLVQDWPPGLYNLKNVITALKKRLREAPSPTPTPGLDPLAEALAKLYVWICHMT